MRVTIPLWIYRKLNKGTNSVFHLTFACLARCSRERGTCSGCSVILEFKWYLKFSLIVMIFKTVKERPGYSCKTSEMLLSRAGSQFAATLRASCTRPSITSPSSRWGQAAFRSLGTAWVAAGASAAAVRLSQPFNHPPAQLSWAQPHTQTEEEGEG